MSPLTSRFPSTVKSPPMEALEATSNVPPISASPEDERVPCTWIEPVASTPAEADSLLILTSSGRLKVT